MNSQGAKLEELVEKTHQASSDEERKQVAEQASKIHEKVTGHAMSIDEHEHSLLEIIRRTLSDTGSTNQFMAY
ncbi:hypothetical protein MUCCIDRAFT_108490 [Mucor lusitanicus CBS 277.49]|uniref:Uncharacterized protein n=1 Tax=Mucor lusitanicus CBS 277.49 TaxID=747725 RepID=A0A168MBA6_MUCCL|nr:hypothetical protein MUCCIDRAFT_108490 [Mucor lusitanicus CBS 277.49]